MGEGKNDTGNTQINEFIDKLEASEGEKTRPARSARVDKSMQDKYSEISQSHDALLDELESSMDRSMQELNARYDVQFSRLDNQKEPVRNNQQDSGEHNTNMIDARLLECGAKVEMLKTRLELSEDDVMKQCTRDIDELQSKLADARRKIAKLEGSAQKDSAGQRTGISNMMSDLSRAVKSLVSLLREAKQTR